VKAVDSSHVQPGEMAGPSEFTSVLKVEEHVTIQKVLLCESNICFRINDSGMSLYFYVCVCEQVFCSC